MPRTVADWELLPSVPRIPYGTSLAWEQIHIRFEVWFLLNAYHSHTIKKSKDLKSNCCKQGTICSFVFFSPLFLLLVSLQINLTLIFCVQVSRVLEASSVVC